VRRIPLGALQEREFRLFFTGQMVSLLGDAVTPFALAWAVLDLTGSARDLGFVLAAKIAPLVVFLLVGGVFADRLPRRGVMLTADVARMAIQAATAALLLSHTARIWELIVLQAFAGTGTAFFNPASTGLTPMTVSAGRLQEANALRGMSMASMQFAGPALAGILIVTVGPGYALAIDAASFGVSAFYLARLHLPLHVGLPPQSFARDLVDGWREFVARTWVWLIVVSVSLGNMMDSVWLVLAAVWIKNGHGLFNTLWETTLQQHVPPASLSRVSAYDWFGSLLCDPLGLALAGVVAAGIGMSHALDRSRGRPCRSRCDTRGAERAAPAAARRAPARAQRAAVRRRLKNGCPRSSAAIAFRRSHNVTVGTRGHAEHAAAAAVDGAAHDLSSARIQRPC
jgi:MFS family permease